MVTGGRGFAARHLVEMLITYNMFSVRIVDLGPSIELEAREEQGILGEALRSGRAQYVPADLRDKAQVLKGWYSLNVSVTAICFCSIREKWLQCQFECCSV